jgi:hypothetical protein
VVEWLTILLPFRQVSGSNLGPETGSPESLFGFSESLQENAGLVP